MELPSYKEPRKTSTSSNSRRKGRKTIFNINSTNIDANRLDLRRDPTNNYVAPRFVSGKITHTKPKFLNATGTPERERRMAANREHKNNYSVSAWRKKKTTIYKNNRPNTFQTFRSVDEDRIPFRPINNNSQIEADSQPFLYEVNTEDFLPQVSSTPFCAPKTNDLVDEEESQADQYLSSDDSDEFLPEEENLENQTPDDTQILMQSKKSSGPKTLSKRRFNPHTTVQLMQDSCYVEELPNVNHTIDETPTTIIENPNEWHPDMISEKMTMASIEEKDNNNDIFKDEEERDILAEIEAYKVKFQDVTGNTIYITRKIPNVELMLEEFKEGNSQYSMDDILGTWDCLIPCMDKVIEREANKKKGQTEE